jgi:hypothetical protein
MHKLMKRVIVTVVICCLIDVRAMSGVFYPDGATTMHFAFEGSPNGDRPIVRPPATYRKDDGFGFVDSPDLIGTARGVTAPKYFRFDVNLPDGTYDITVVMGGTSADSVTTINAEGKATDVKEVTISRGQNLTKTFTVTCGAPDTGKDAKGNSLNDGRLNLEFTGTNPSLMKLDIKPSQKSN